MALRGRHLQHLAVGEDGLVCRPDVALQPAELAEQGHLLIGVALELRVPSYHRQQIGPAAGSAVALLEDLESRDVLGVEVQRFVE